MPGVRTAYVRIDLGDPDETTDGMNFLISQTPFLYREGELVVPSNTQIYKANSYSELWAILKSEFQIPRSMLPNKMYFKPSEIEDENQESHIYRTVPEGTGEPEWRTRARQALLDAVDQVSWAFRPGDGKVEINGTCCHSIEELRHELELLAQEAAGKEFIDGKPYQPDYEVMVTEALTRDDYLLRYSGLPKSNKAH